MDVLMGEEGVDMLMNVLMGEEGVDKGYVRRYMTPLGSQFLAENHNPGSWNSPSAHPGPWAKIRDLSEVVYSAEIRLEILLHRGDSDILLRRVDSDILLRSYNQIFYGVRR